MTTTRTSNALVFPALLALALAACSADKSAPADAADAADAAAEKVADMATPAAEPAPAAPAAEPVPPGAEIPADTLAAVFGKGTLERDDGKLATFEIDVTFQPEDKVAGTIKYTTFLDDGKIDLVAQVDCGHYEMSTTRAWLAGKIEENKSNHPEYKDGRYAAGQPVWLRFEESATHPEPPAKVSDLGFAGDGGVESSDDYCASKAWGEEGLKDLSEQGAVVIFALPAGMN